MTLGFFFRFDPGVTSFTGAALRLEIGGPR
jgi:hypothetical protein